MSTNQHGDVGLLDTVGSQGLEQGLNPVHDDEENPIERDDAYRSMTKGIGAVSHRKRVMLASVAVGVIAVGFIAFFLSLAKPGGVKGDGEKGADKEYIIVDTDVSIDDIGALGMLFRHTQPSSPTVISAITTVNGVATSPYGTQITTALLHGRWGLDTPVTTGSPNPVSGNNTFPAGWRTAAASFALPPLSNVTTPPTLSRAGARVMVDLVKQYPGQVVIFAIGPLTNLALAVQIGGSSFVDNVKAVVWSGGGLNTDANGTPNNASEWNSWIDPDAGALVFKQAWKSIAMVGLDVMNKAPVTTALSQRLWSFGPVVDDRGRVVREAVSYLENWVDSKLYDILAAIYLLQPGLFTTKEYRIAVKPLSDPQAGRTYDAGPGTAGTPTQVVTDLSLESVLEFLRQSLQVQALGL